MVRSFLDNIAIPGFAAACVAGVALASTGAATLGQGQAGFDALSANARAEMLFNQADLDRSGDLDINEFTALNLVLAELSRVSGRVVLEMPAGEAAVELDDALLRQVTSAERSRLEAVSFREFQLASDADDRMTLDEFVGLELEYFEAADRNDNGVLAGSELSSYAHRIAKTSKAAA